MQFKKSEVRVGSLKEAAISELVNAEQGWAGKESLWQLNKELQWNS